jgi:hypothetical protein
MSKHLSVNVDDNYTNYANAAEGVQKRIPFIHKHKDST